MAENEAHQIGNALQIGEAPRTRQIGNALQINGEALQIGVGNVKKGFVVVWVLLLFTFAQLYEWYLQALVLPYQAELMMDALLLELQRTLYVCMSLLTNLNFNFLKSR
jgi:hypothetical protein